ncbi:hypothetical protein [Patulibacter sp. SYSU D01012]|uniref:hypothetical protein n=1 Tax=Patulibacter sp. SYSU D01012 TaxID=2817381 RepID=UPI001B3056AD|nr:hypothetical protein [Patulibacter sp. SYSU D01012]
MTRPSGATPRRRRPRRPRALAAGAVLATLVVVATVLSLLYRRSYGAWFPGAPDRVEVCGRRFSADGPSAPTLAAALPAGFRARPLGRRPPVVGWAVYQARRGAGGCTTSVVLRRRSDGRIQPYVLSGGP